jgi:hypothetical protein
MAAEWPRNWGIVRRMSYAGEPWHVVEVPDDFDWRHGDTDRPARCGATPWLGTWGTVAGTTGHERICKRCLKAPRGTGHGR